MEEFENYDSMLTRVRDLVDRWETEEANRPGLVEAHLASLPSLSARHEAAVALRTISESLTGCTENVPAIDWEGLRAPRIRTIRHLLLDRYDPDYVRDLSDALRALLDTSLRLGYLTAPEHREALAEL